MKKMAKRMTVCMLVVVFVWLGSVLADRQKLREELIRFHVVASSDRQDDQARKLAVRDAVLESLRQDMEALSDVNAAREYIVRNIPKIQTIAKNTLQSLGCSDSVMVSLCEEAFDRRVYDTFTLPAGVYDALRIVIGDGAGKNWWCVVFPELCIPTAAEGFAEVAAGAGFSRSLQGALTGEESCEIRFFLLEMLGKLENSMLKE